MITQDNIFSELAQKGYLNSTKEEILQAISLTGKWHDYVEWRISTETLFEIKREKFKSENWFRVTVECDHIFSCICPTLDRAIEMAGLYQQLIMNLAYQIGWPSWANKSKPS